MEFEDTQIKRISAEEFKELLAKDRDSVTVLDLREPDEVLIHPIDGAINVPFSKVSSELPTKP